MNVSRTCDHCKQPYSPTKTNQRFCKPSHRVSYFQAKNGRKRSRDALREAVFARDGHSCRVCAEDMKRLVVRQTEAGDRAVENCTTLCLSCNARASAQLFFHRTGVSLLRYRNHKKWEAQYLGTFGNDVRNFVSENNYNVAARWNGNSR